MRLVACLALLLSAAPAIAQTQKDPVIVRRHPDDETRLQAELRQAFFTVPKNWKPNLAGGPNKSAVILTFGAETKEEDLTARIDIGIGISKAPTSKDLAETWAKEWAGVVEKETVQLDGEEAYRVTIPADGTLKPTEAILLVKDKRGFMLMGGAKEPSKALSEALEEIRKTWKWKPSDPPK